jgi:hypothetical protein
MPLVAFTVKLARIDESLLYQDPGGNYWLSCVCTLDQDAKNHMVMAQSIPKERYLAGEKGPAVGTWREIGASKPEQSGKPAFDLAKYKKPPAQNGPSQQDARPQGQESLFPSPQAAFDAANGPRQEPKPAEPHGFDDLGF